MTKTSLLLLCLLLTYPATLRATWSDPHVEGAKEHPLLKYYPQAHVGEFEQKEFDSVEIVTAYEKGADDPWKRTTVEGRITKYKYEHKPGTSQLEVVRQYEGALKQVGFTTLFATKCTDSAPCPEQNHDDAFGVFKLDKGGKTVAYVYVSSMAAGEGPDSHVTIAEPKGMEQKLEADAGAMFDSLTKTGRVAVYGINFDTGKATIKPDSEKVLEEVRKLVKSHPELKLRIEGHTDNVGAPAANKKLSEDRAVAVKTWLASNGGNAANLSTAGFGDSKPIGDNKTEEGKAKNRRVELVKQ